MGRPYSKFSFPDNFLKIFEFPGRDSLLSAQDAVEKAQVGYLQRYLTEMHCQSILIEHDYVDHDYLDDYSSYYSKCFAHYGRFCNRAHFWTIDIAEDSLEQLILDLEHDPTERLQESYLGFVVVKPLPNTAIGRTVLKNYDSDGEHRFFGATRNYDINLFGLKLHQRSLAFQEQDQVLAACATTALWSAFQKCSSLWGTGTPTPSEITLSATKYLQKTRPIPSRGLIVEQMCYAISSNGLTPEVQEIGDDTPIVSLIASYVAAGIPVILGFSIHGRPVSHAVTVCGFRLEREAVFSSETKHDSIALHMIGGRISELYVQDDNLGPFTRLICHDDSSLSLNGQRNRRCFLREIHTSTGTHREVCLPWVIIVPLYHKIRLTFTAVKHTIREFHVYLKAIGVDPKDANNPHGLEWDIKLIDLCDLRELIRKAPSIPDEEKLRYLFASLPRFNWLCTARLDQERVFGLVSDATDMERSFFVSGFLEFIPGVRKVIRDAIVAADADLSKAGRAKLSASFLDFLRKEFHLQEVDE